jgi:hypothetical protein
VLGSVEVLLGDQDAVCKTPSSSSNESRWSVVVGRCDQSITVEQWYGRELGYNRIDLS